MSLETRKERRAFAKNYGAPNISEVDAAARSRKKAEKIKKRRKQVKASRRANR